MAQHASDTYPLYSRPEKIADGTVHILGVLAAIAATFALLALPSPPASIIAAWVYGICATTALAASAAYHMTPREAWRPKLRRFDHAMIFFKIAGTYAPLVVLIGTSLAYGVLALVWAIALYGATRKLFFWRTPKGSSVWLYLGMGWLSVILGWPLIQAVPTATVWWTAAGGLLYSGGVVFYKWESLRFSNAIWHGFVLTASACFFIGIYIAQLAANANASTPVL